MFVDQRDEVVGGGHVMTSETDTELVAHLLEDRLAKEPGLAAAMRAVCQRLDGTFTLVAVDVQEPDVVVGARRNSPLVVGRGSGENFLASDVAAFISHTREATEIAQNQAAEIRPDAVSVTNSPGPPPPARTLPATWRPPAP